LFAQPSYAQEAAGRASSGRLKRGEPSLYENSQSYLQKAVEGEPKSFEEFFIRAFVALSAAFSPNPQRAPFYVDFPYQEREGRLEKNDRVHAEWRSKMPLYMVDERKENLLKLRGIFVDYGQKDEFSHIRITTTLFSKALADRNIPHVFEVYDEGGDHGNRIGERVEKRLLQFFSERLDFSS
jgi:hypothetical protein